MKQILQNSLSKGLTGAHSHINPLDAIADIDAAIARKRLNDNSHSIWEILYHLVTWQDIFIENIKGNNPDWEVQSWPSEELMQIDENLEELKVRFKEGIVEIENLVKTVDLEKGLPFWHNDPILQFVIIAITHNSYHIGQIITIKKT